MNLIPKEEKDLIKKGFKLRIFILACFFIAMSFLLGTLLLLPPYVLTKTRLDLVFIANSLNKNEDENLVKDMLKIPKEIGSKIDFMSFQTKNKSITDTIKDLVLNKNDGIKIDSISIDRQTEKNKEKLNIIVSGIALERKDLVLFENSLLESKKFKSVEVPVSSFTKDKDLPFTLNISILNEKLDS